jgi:hypothetical protein
MASKVPPQRPEHANIEPVGARVDRIALILPPPDNLEDLSDEIPDHIVAILLSLADHSMSDIAELSQLIPDKIFAPTLSQNLVALTQPQEATYDEYFSVGRAIDRPRLRLVLALLLALRAAALNASLGYDLEPAAVADFLKSVRVMANLLLSSKALKSKHAAEEDWPKGIRPNGPW